RSFAHPLLSPSAPLFPCSSARLHLCSLTPMPLRTLHHSNDSFNRNRLAFVHKNLLQNAGSRRRQFRVHFIGTALHQHLPFFNYLSRLFHSFHDRSFGDTFSNLGNDDFNRHQNSTSFRAASKMRSALGANASSSGGLNGTGVSSAVTLMIGP